MRPTILKIEHLDDRVRMSRESGVLLELEHKSLDAQPVLRALDGLRESVGRDTYFVLAMVEKNQSGGEDIVPTFRRVVDAELEPDW